MVTEWETIEPDDFSPHKVKSINRKNFWFRYKSIKWIGQELTICQKYKSDCIYCVTFWNTYNQ